MHQERPPNTAVCSSFPNKFEFVVVLGLCSASVLDQSTGAYYLDTGAPHVFAGVHCQSTCAGTWGLCKKVLETCAIHLLACVRIPRYCGLFM